MTDSHLNSIVFGCVFVERLLDREMKIWLKPPLERVFIMQIASRAILVHNVIELPVLS